MAYALLEQAGAGVRAASARLRPVIAGARRARLLEIGPESPLLQIEQIDLDERGRPVMLSSEWHVPDVFEVHVNRRSPRPLPSTPAAPA